MAKRTSADKPLRLVIDSNVLSITPFYHWNLINSDKDDNKYVDCSIAGQADYIVTEDAHFDILTTISFPRVKVINIDKFISLLLVD